MALALAMAMAFAAPAGAEGVETRMLDERIAVDEPAGIEIVVDNVFGSVKVTGHGEPVVTLSAVETVRADTQADVDRARAEVSLQTVREPGRVAFLVRRDDDCDCDRWRRWNDYIVAYDIELRVPHEAAIDISTVIDGEIVVESVYGSFRVSNVNGDVSLRGLREAGHAETVNGELGASFERAPESAASFETVNGEIDVAVPTGMSADLLFKTMRGEIWTDFEVAALPVTPVPETQQGRRTVIRADRHAAVRVNTGGPAHTFETLNGDIFVRETH
jgi:hypothetical protein